MRGRYRGAANHVFAPPDRSIGLKDLGLTDMTTGNRNMNKAAFLTADQLEKLADAAASQASHLLEGEERRNALSLAARLRVYAIMKRALTPPAAKLK